MFLFKCLGVIFALFIVLFVAVVIEESFLGAPQETPGARRTRYRTKQRILKQAAACLRYQAAPPRRGPGSPSGYPRLHS